MIEVLALDKFQVLIDSIEHGSEAGTVESVLGRLCSMFDLQNAVYLGVNIPQSRSSGIFVATTYRKEWKDHYLAQRYDRIDPVVQTGLRRITPLDWAELDRSPPKMRQFFGEAEEFGVGGQGLSFPIRGIHGELGLFSVNTDCSATEWESLKAHNTRDLQSLAFYLHTFVLKSLGVSNHPQPKLSQREVECLTWAAAGKTEWATAEILNLSIKTVRFHLENAKVKLNCVTKTQAVAKSIRLSMI